MKNKHIDLRSDTVTLPSKEMREVMQQAELGDDVFQEDPTTIKLEMHLATLFGMEAGLFCPSGTMTNQIAIRMHTQPGQEVICHKESHVYKYEGGGIMVNSACSVKLIDGNRGRLTADDVLQSCNNPEDVHLPLTHLVCLEDTANRGGGAIYDFTEIEKISAVCKNKKFKLHLDGARVFNALVETKIDYKKYAACFDSISICLSKGLGSPIGSVLIGKADDIKRARRIRKVLGGGMRQVGVIAAAGLYAVEHNVQRLLEDHQNARAIAKMAEKLSFVTEIFPVDTNIVVMRVNEKIVVEEVLAKLKEHNVLAVAFGPKLIRMVTHLDFSKEQLNQLEGVFKKIDQ